MSAFCLPLYERNRKTGKFYQICLSISEYSLPSEYDPRRYRPSSSVKSRSSRNVDVDVLSGKARRVRCIVIGKNTSSVTIVVLVLIFKKRDDNLPKSRFDLFSPRPTIWFFINAVHVTRDFLSFFGSQENLEKFRATCYGS